MAGEDTLSNAKELLQNRFSMLTERVFDKIADYEGYSFSAEESRALTIFFDLAQEYDNLEDLYTISIIVPKVFYSMHACLYMLTKEHLFRKERCSHAGLFDDNYWEREILKDTTGPFVRDNTYFFPIRANRKFLYQLPIQPIEDVIGLLVIWADEDLNMHEVLFFEKFANRIGFQIHNKMTNLKNLEHISFIQTLVTDIGHNVIVPNMYYKLLFRQLQSKIVDLKSVLDRAEARNENLDDAEPFNHADIKELKELHAQLNQQYKEIYSHFEQTSLFLESLLRRSHFEKGQYVLVKRTCNFKSQIIEPQINRFRSRLEEKGIEVDTSMGGVPDEDVRLAADIGLLSQVFANLFSNAVKYTKETRDAVGRPRKFLSYGWERIPAYFRSGKSAIKLNVFTTGPHIPSGEREHLFDPQFRSSSARGEYGTGHGLFFVKEIVELHGGEVGYEPTEMGNNFYIVLPCE